MEEQKHVYLTGACRSKLYPITNLDIIAKRALQEYDQIALVEYNPLVKYCSREYGGVLNRRGLRNQDACDGLYYRLKDVLEKVDIVVSCYFEGWLDPEFYMAQSMMLDCVVLTENPIALESLAPIPFGCTNVTFIPLKPDGISPDLQGFKEALIGFIFAT